MQLNDNHKADGQVEVEGPRGKVAWQTVDGQEGVGPLIALKAARERVLVLNNAGDGRTVYRVVCEDGSPDRPEACEGAAICGSKCTCADAAGTSWPLDRTKGR